MCTNEQASNRARSIRSSAGPISRQRTFKAKDNGNETMRCKFVVNMPEAENFETMEEELMQLFSALNVTGKVVDKHKKDPYENAPSW